MIIAAGLLQFSLAFGGFIAFIAVMFYWGYLSEKRRTEAFQEQAEQMGLHFVDNPDGAAYHKFDGFRLFSRGYSRKMKNLIEGDSGDVKISIFDYRYTTGSGKNSKTSRQTVAALQSPLLRCPDFTMRPEGFLDKIGNAMGFQDLDFDTHPEFSKLFVLKGPDEAAIRAYFTSQVLDFFEKHAGNSIEASGDTMFFYRLRRISKPEELKDLLAQAYEAYGVLSEANA